MKLLDRTSAMEELLELKYSDLRTHARQGDHEAQKEFAWLLYDTGCYSFDEDRTIFLEPEDEPWLAALAEEGFWPAIEAYIKATVRLIYVDTEDFLNEDTGEMDSIESRVIHDLKRIFDVPEEKKIELIQHWIDLLFEQMIDDVYSDETCFLEDVYDFPATRDVGPECGMKLLKIIEAIEDKDPKHPDTSWAYDWARRLASLYYDGKPGWGVYRNAAKATEYARRAQKIFCEGNKIRCENMEYYTKPYNGEYHYDYIMEIAASAEQRKAIVSLTDKVGDRFGTPADESPLSKNIPVESLMKILVGSDEYSGNIKRIQEKEDKLEIEIAAEKAVPEALKYGLIQSFGQMNISISEK